MNPFDARWKTAARVAQSSTPEQDDSAPFGFATRIVAQWPAPENPFALPQRLLSRALGFMTAILVLLATLAEFSDRDREALRPPIEDTVAELFDLQ